MRLVRIKISLIVKISLIAKIEIWKLIQSRSSWKALLRIFHSCSPCRWSRRCRTGSRCSREVQSTFHAAGKLAEAPMWNSWWLVAYFWLEAGRAGRAEQPLEVLVSSAIGPHWLRQWLFSNYESSPWTLSCKSDHSHSFYCLTANSDPVSLPFPGFELIVR